MASSWSSCVEAAVRPGQAFANESKSGVMDKIGRQKRKSGLAQRFFHGLGDIGAFQGFAHFI